MTRAAGLEPDVGCRIEFERVLNAAPEVVFEAFSTAEHLGRWWGPAGFSTTTSAFEFKPGGAWRFVMHGPGGRDYPNRVIFEMIEPPARIVAQCHGEADEARHVMVI